MFNTILMMSLCAGVMLFVRAEVYAMLQAVAYARKCKGSLPQKLNIGSLRYAWGSFFWHETFALANELRPAYRVSYPLFVWLGAFVLQLGMVWVMEGPTAPISAATMLMNGFSCAAIFFAVAYGPSFTAHRKHIVEQDKAGTWQLAYANA